MLRCWRVWGGRGLPVMKNSLMGSDERVRAASRVLSPKVDLHRLSHVRHPLDLIEAFIRSEHFFKDLSAGEAFSYLWLSRLEDGQYEETAAMSNMLWTYLDGTWDTSPDWPPA